MASEESPFLASVVEEGQTIIVFIGRDDLLPLKVTCGKTTQTRYGAIEHRSLIGMRLGSQVKATKGYVYILPLTPELWTLALPHRTQVLYAADISYIITMLDIVPGRIVAEAGTGSGSLTHAIARAVLPCGKVYTFDFHDGRVKTAVEEFQSHGLSRVVECGQRDVVNDGFGLPSIVDAVVLDLPNPWEVIPHLKSIFKTTGGRLCCFSPCVEQVQRTCLALRQSGDYGEISTVECKRRRMDMIRRSLPEANVGQASAKHFIEAIKKEEQPCQVLSDRMVTCGLTEDPARCQREHQAGAILNTTDEVKTSIAAAQPFRNADHTGYLTFASYCPHSV